MPRLAALLSIVVWLTAGTAAHAAEVIGWITSINADNDEITLGNGQTFAVPDDISLASLMENICVKIGYRETNGARVMTDIAPAATDAPACDAAAVRPKKASEADPRSWPTQRRIGPESLQRAAR